MLIAISWLAIGATKKICNQSNLLQNQPIIPQSTHFCDRPAQSAFVLFNNMLSQKKTSHLLCSFLKLFS
jgi:hypothetical protein